MGGGGSATMQRADQLPSVEIRILLTPNQMRVVFGLFGLGFPTHYDGLDIEFSITYARKYVCIIRPFSLT